MADWDRLEARLKDLEEAAGGWVDELPDPADVRRLGARRRRRRWAAVAAVAAVLAIGGGAGAYAVGALPQHREPVPAGSPTVHPSPTPSKENSDKPVGYGRRMETKTMQPRGPQQIPPSYPSYPGEPSSPETPTSPTPTPTPTPTGTGASETPEPVPTQTREPEPVPTSGPTDDGGAEPTQAEPQPGDDGSTR